MTVIAEQRRSVPMKLLIVLANLIPAALIIYGFCYGMNALNERSARKFAEDQRTEIARGIALTAKGCPGARAKIAEITADGVTTRREIEVLSAVITVEQARPGGLETCRAPSWEWFWGGWDVSQGYAN